MNLRPLVILPLVLTSCANPNTDETRQVSLQDAGPTSSMTSDGADALDDDAGTVVNASIATNTTNTLATNPTDEPNPDSGAASATSDEATDSTAAESDVSAEQPTAATSDAGVSSQQHDAATQSDETSDNQTTATTTSGDLSTETPGCGNGQVSATEQCDDGNVAPNDGCSPSCRLERGFKCDDEPSVCSPVVCGNATREGAEDCDDGNDDAFDGCSPSCVSEPSCSGVGCTSTCGDGLVVNEGCDDGNLQSGDGCSETCTVEANFTCTQAPCEQLNGTCVVRVDAIHRDFADSTPDFGIALSNLNCGAGAAAGFVGEDLDTDGLPVLGGPPPDSACVQDATSFAAWFRQGTQKVDELVLFDNGAGGFVNRFGPNGEQFVYVVAGPNEQLVPGATSLETCTPGCESTTSTTVQCENECRPSTTRANDANAELNALRPQLDATTNPELMSELQSEIAALELELAELTAEAESCMATCEQDFQALVDICVNDCKPCSSGSDQWCTGGEYVYADGSPLYFPVDDVTGATAEFAEAKLPPEYGYEAWAWEDQIFPDAPPHNFSFTTELRSWFRYDAEQSLALDFMSDDDLFVFINGHLALDLGGAHTPLSGSILLDETTAALFQLQADNVYEFAVFKAERQYQSSTLLVTLPPPVNGKSICNPVTP